MRCMWQLNTRALSPDTVVTRLAEDAGQQRPRLASSSNRGAHARLFGLMRGGVSGGCLSVKQKDVVSFVHARNAALPAQRDIDHCFHAHTQTWQAAAGGACSRFLSSRRVPLASVHGEVWATAAGEIEEASREEKCVVCVSLSYRPSCAERDCWTEVGERYQETGRGRWRGPFPTLGNFQTAPSRLLGAACTMLEVWPMAQSMVFLWLW